MRDFLDRVNVARIVTRHLKTLTGPLMDVDDVSWSQLRLYDVILFYGVPLLAGALSLALGLRIRDLEPGVIALTLFATLLLTILFQTLSMVERARDRLGNEVTSNWADQQVRRRSMAITATYHTLAYLFLVCLALLALTVALASLGLATESEPLGAGWTAVLGGSATHVGLTLLLILNRLYESLQGDLRDHNSSLRS